MKQFLIICLLFFVATIVYSQAPFQIRSAKIDFVFYMGTGKGTKTIIFDDSGRIAKMIGSLQPDTSIDFEKLGFPKNIKEIRKTINSLYIQSRDSVYNIDLDSLTGSKTVRVYWNIQSMFPPNKKIGEKIFLNKVCDIMETPLGKMLYYKGFCVNKGFESEENVYEYAVSIDENYKIRDDEFRVPANVKIK